MTQQDRTRKWSDSSSGGGGGHGRSSKKPKQKKVPQRGLGVAQLEKIRIEEQQRKEADAAASASAIVPPPSSSPSPSKSYLPLQPPGFHHSNIPPPSSPVSLHPGITVDFLRSPPSHQNLDAAKAYSCTVPLENSGNVDSTWPSSIQLHGHENVHMSMNSVYESNHTWPVFNWTQRTQQYQQPSSSMVNVSSGNLTSPVYHYSKEPPSNQNYSSSCVPMRAEDKMIGLKRSYPFSLDVPPASSFNFKSPAFATNVITNESTSSRAYGTGLNFGAASSAFREVHSCSTPTPSSEPNSRKNENFSGGFLSLAPPISPSKSNSTSTLPAFHNQLELPHLGLTPFQGTEEDKIPHGQQQCLHSFFPPKDSQTAVQTTEKTNTDGNCNCEMGSESVDLSLKL